MTLGRPEQLRVEFVSATVPLTLLLLDRLTILSLNLGLMPLPQLVVVVPRVGTPKPPLYVQVASPRLFGRELLISVLLEVVAEELELLL